MTSRFVAAYLFAIALVLGVAFYVLQPPTSIAYGAPPPAPPLKNSGTSASTTFTGPALPNPPGLAESQQQSDGELRIVKEDGTAGEFCPLKHTDVQAEISGFLSRVTVTQQFTNPSPDKVEAIYAFPLPQNAAVDNMTLHVGGHTIRGLIKRREEAQRIYEQAKQAGHVAALLDQERPNIFTQSVANIPPGGNVEVEISYVETLKYEAGTYEFVFPMVVGPRYIPGSPTGNQAGGWSPDTTDVPDASRITPPVAGVHYGKRGTRAGHDISLQVKLDAGVIVQDLKSPLHQIDVQHLSASSAIVRLKNENEIPNRDFVLQYKVAGSSIEDAMLVHATPPARETQGGGIAEDAGLSGGYFTFILQPPDRVRDEDATPRQLIFVLDTSGSMNGYPLDTAKKVMRRAIEHLRPGDTFNLITFSGDTHILFPSPVMATSSNIQTAIDFMEGQRGGGGTEMMKAIRAALGEDAGDCYDCLKPVSQQSSAAIPVRIVCFMTDGYVGNDMQIIGEVKKHADARVFSFGIGTSVNRFLLERMADAGRGEVEFVTRPEDADEAADRFYERVHTPVLTDISIDWNGLPVKDVIPARLPDLFSAKPLVISGRYDQAAHGVIRLRGLRAGKPFSREIKVDLPASQPANQSLAQLWARRRIAELMSQDWQGMQTGTPGGNLKEQITQLGLNYRLMTQFTSFVAVEEQTVVEGGRTRTIQVPVEMPQGVNPDTVFGPQAESRSVNIAMSPGFAGGLGSGFGSGRAISPKYSASEMVVVQNAPGVMKDEVRKTQRRELQSKLHPALLAAYDCWLNSSGGAEANCAGVSRGNVQIELWFSGDRAQLLSRLQALGLRLDPNQPPDHTRGTLAISKLPELAALDHVTLVSLQRKK